MDSVETARASSFVLHKMIDDGSRLQRVPENCAVRENARVVGFHASAKCVPVNFVEGMKRLRCGYIIPDIVLREVTLQCV